MGARGRLRCLVSGGMRRLRRSQQGYVLILAMLILMAMGMAAATLLVAAQVNQQHAARDRAYTASLAVAEAGLNQYLWMLASGASSISNNWGIAGNTGPDPHFEQTDLTDIHTGEIQGTYAIQVTPPDETTSNVQVVVTGQASSTADAPRTVYAQLGRPSFSQYILLTNDEVWIGGPLTRQWFGKTHSNTGICIDTANINDTVSCANASYSSGMFGGNRNGVWSGHIYTVPSGDASRKFWTFPVPAVDFNTVTSDFAKLSALAVGTGVNIPYATAAAHDSRQGWYIKLLPNKKYQIRRVTGETESPSYSSGNDIGGTLTISTSNGYGIGDGAYDYPTNGVIYVNDNVWVEGTNINGRITIASSGQLNVSGKNASTSIHVVGDLVYKYKDGTVAVGLIAQQNIEIPRYAPWQKGGQVQNQDMEIDAAMIAQTGRESCNAADASGNQYGPIRDMLTIYGSVATYHTPYRSTVDNDGDTLGGFESGTNSYDPFLLHNPPPYTPVVGSYQIINWKELPGTQGVLPD
jgi:Tfp pilus assembly protein PilX